MGLREQNIIIAEEKLNSINQQLLEHEWQTNQLGLFHGKIGGSLYFYILSRLIDEKNKKTIYLRKAEELLEEVYEQLNIAVTQTGFSDGLAGIAYTFFYLIKEEYVEGNADDILEIVDDTIFRQITHSSQLPTGLSNGILGYILYLIPRTKKRGGFTQKLDTNYVFKRLLILLVNHLGEIIEEQKIKSNEPPLFDLTWDLPICLVLLADIKELNIYDKKIDKILEQLSESVLSIYPRLQSNRLNLLVGIEYIVKKTKLREWKMHADLLRQNIDLQYIINKEIKDKDILLGNGVLGIYWLAKRYNQVSDERLSFQIDFDQYISRIINSAYWNPPRIDNEERILNTGFLFGLSGIGLCLGDLIKSMKKKEINSLKL